MLQGRDQQTATLLATGLVLVAGGNAGGGAIGALNEAELYHPSTNAWSAAGTMAIGRQAHTATLLRSGKVLVVGGIAADGHSTASAELYDPATNTWSSAPNMATPRYGHVAALLASGRVLVAGGQNPTGYIAKAELYDPVANSWSPAAAMQAGYFGSTATVLETGLVLVAGGDTFGDHRAQLYDPTTDRWSNAGIMGQSNHTATLLHDGRVLVAGGTGSAGTQIYDPTLNSWSAAASMLADRAGHTATLLDDGDVLVAGGSGFDSGQQVWLASAERYHPQTNTWTPAGSMAAARWAHTATLLRDHRVLIAGGMVPRDCCALSGAELFDPQGTMAQASASPSPVIPSQAASQPPQSSVIAAPTETTPIRPPVATAATSLGANLAADRWPLALGGLAVCGLAAVVTLVLRRRRLPVRRRRSR